MRRPLPDAPPPLPGAGSATAARGRPEPRRAFAAAALAAVALVLLYHRRAAAPGQALIGEDLRNFFFAVREATAAALRGGRLPGWQRGMFLGYPLLGDPQAAVFDPATWLFLPWDAPRALTLGALLHLSFAAVGMVVWLRVRGLGAPEALLGAVLFALGAKQTVHLQHWNFAASTAWWPWILAGLDGFAARGGGRWLLLAASSSAFSWFGGAAQMAYFGAAVASAYALVLAPGLWRRRRLDAVLALAAAPIGLLLAAPLLLPAAELARLGPRGAGVAYRFATSWQWPDRFGLALLLLPRAYGGGWVRPEMNLWEATGYLGILPLGLVAAAPLRRRGAWLFLALGVLGIWLSFGEDSWLGLHHAFYRFLPGYGAFRNPTRSLMVTLLASAVLAAEALGALRRGDGAWRGFRAGLALTAVALLAPRLPLLPGFSLDPAAAAADARVALALALAGLAWLAAGAVIHPPSQLAGAPPTAGRRGLRAAWALAPAAIAVVDLHLAFGEWNRVAPAAREVGALTDLAPLVPASPAPRRVGVVARWGETANAPLRRGWEGVTGYGPTLVQRVRTLLEATPDGRIAPPQPVDRDTNFPRPDPASPLWPLFSAPLVVSDAPELLPRVAALKPEWNLATSAYRAEALPRVFWAGSWSAAPDGAVAAPLLAAARGDRAVLAADGPLAPFAPPGAPAGPLAAEDMRVDGGTVEATVDAPRPGVAVVLEPWFPGWSATVDGEAAPVARADYAFMAVPVSEGRHRLRLEYRNVQVGRGLAVAAGAAALLTAVLGWRCRSGARPAATSPASLARERASLSNGSDRA